MGEMTGRRMWASPSAAARSWRGTAAFATELGTVCLTLTGALTATPVVSLASAALATPKCTLTLPQHRLTAANYTYAYAPYTAQTAMLTLAVFPAATGAAVRW